MKSKKMLRVVSFFMSFLIMMYMSEIHMVRAGINTEYTIVSNDISDINNFLWGDADGDGKVSLKDAQITLKVVLKIEPVLKGESFTRTDVNKDKTISLLDVQIILKIALKIPVELPDDDFNNEDIQEPAIDNCNHTNIEKVGYKASTCTAAGNIAHWYCSDCKSYFKDEEGNEKATLNDITIEILAHNVVIDLAIPSTRTSTGLTEGSHCSVCNTILKKQEEIPMLAENQYSITYNLYDNDNYLQQVGVENSNPYYYTSEDGLKLANLKVEGYIFEGWYDGAGANGTLFKEIAPNTTGNIELYARWTPVEYTIKFDSPLVAVESINYTVNQGATLTNPEWFGYTFVGWSDDDGNIVTRIKTGTTGNMTLHANWTSKRNQTIPVKELGDPIIIEDTENQQYLFTYELGRIENVPLYTIKDFGNTSGIIVKETISSTGTISETSADTIAQMISNATTRSSAWTLSEEWNKSSTVSESHSNEVGMEAIHSATENFEESGKWNLGGSVGGSKTVTDAYGVSGKIHNTNKLNLSLENIPLEIEGIDMGDLGMGLESEFGWEIGADYKHTEENTKNWNIDLGFEHSETSSSSETISQALSQKINDEYGYSQSTSQGGSESITNELATSQTDTREYSSSFAYSAAQSETTTLEYSNEDAPEGYYRLVCAGTLHVFGVVGYDIASSTYFTYTYTVMDDELKKFIDYSKTTSAYDDYQNGVLPFEVPYYVNAYVDSVIGCSKGLVVDIETGKIVDYNGEAEHVIVPKYKAVDNGDGTTTVVKINGFDSKVFAGNATIKSVKLPESVTELPDSAFAGCTCLTKIYCPSVTKIGSNVFDGCMSLKEFDISNKVTSLGTNAFGGVQKVVVDANNTEIVENAVYSGANSITINLASLTDTLKDKVFTITEETDYFEFNGANKSYSGLRIQSDAGTTIINGVTFTDNKEVPMKIGSSKVTLNRVTAYASELVLILFADNTSLDLYGTVHIASEGDNAILCKNVSLGLSNNNAAGKLNVSGNMLICGAVDGEGYLSFGKGKIIYIDNTSFEQMALNSLEWVLAEEVPENAQIISEKWTYDLTTNIQSDKSYVSGYTLYNTTSEWGSYGVWSSWSTNVVSSSDSRQVQTQQVSDNNAYTQNNYYYYRYWNSSYGQYLYTYSSGMGGTKYTFSQRSGAQPAMYAYGNYSGYTGYRLSSGSVYFSDELWFLESTTTVPATSHTEYRYRDRSKVYTYYHTKKESKESTTEIQESDTISNVQKWVQYVIQ